MKKVYKSKEAIMESEESIKKRMVEWIDSASYEDLLRKWRFAPSGDPYFAGEMGEYFKIMMGKRKAELSPAGSVAASKRVGWDS